MNKLVSIGIPIYKRLQYLPHVLENVAAQDYPAVELIVSDNGQNGPKIKEIIEAHYRRPYRLRSNPVTVTLAEHFNQVIGAASAEYAMILADDDEISANYVSELVAKLESHPEAVIALGAQEILNSDGMVIRRTKDNLPDLISGEEFIRRCWPMNEFRYECFATFLTRTAEFKACGGYEEFTGGNHSDNAIVIKLGLGRQVVFSPRCFFRWRIDETSQGWSVSIQKLAAATREFLQFLEKDSVLRRYSEVHPVEWEELKARLVRMAWETYFWRWRDIYRKRMTRSEWARAGFALPFIRPYYRSVAGVFAANTRGAVKTWLKGLFARESREASGRG